MEIRKNIPLIVAIVVPLGMVGIVAASVYVPAFFAHPKVNFLYAVGDNYYASSEYVVQDHTFFENILPGATSNLTLYVHNAADNTNREVSYEEARSFKLDSGTTSPDGFQIVQGRSSGGLFGGGNGYNTYYLMGHAASMKLNVELGNPAAYYNFHFLGWIE